MHGIAFPFLCQAHTMKAAVLDGKHFRRFSTAMA